MIKNQSEIAYEIIRRKILDRELRPGAKVRYGPLGVEIGMSATPIREAIGRLASDGLVDLVPQSGAVIKRPTRSDAIEVFEMREAIEPFAAARAAQLIGGQQLMELQRSLDAMKAICRTAVCGKSFGKEATATFDDADLQFHQTILESVNNRRMLKAVGDFHLLTAIIGTERHDYHSDVLQMTIDDHAAILDGLQQRNSEAVRRAMLTHILNSRQITMAAFVDSQPSSLASALK